MEPARHQRDRAEDKAPRGGERIRLTAAMFFAAILMIVGCGKTSPAPQIRVAATSRPVIADSQPDTRPAGSYTVTQETVIGRLANGKIDYEAIEAGTPVLIVRADREWSRVRTPDGREGLVPTARLDPKISFQTPAPAAAVQFGPPVVSWVAGPTAPSAAGTSAPLASREVKPQEQVDSAVSKASRYLLSQMQHGNWEASPAPLPGDPGFRGARWGSLSTLALYALLSNGQTPPPELSAALDWLKGAPITATSAVALREQIARVQAPPHLAVPSLISEDAHLLIRAMIQGGQDDGLFAEDDASGRGTPDFDATQSAVQGMSAMQQAGAEFPHSLWERLDQGSARSQHADGSWGAAPDLASRAGATADGALIRVTIRDSLPAMPDVECRGTVTDESLGRAMSWLDAHAVDALAQTDALWRVQAAVSATGRKYLGEAEFYRLGAHRLVRTQLPDGSWPAQPGADPAGRGIPETAYALLFLSCGRSPLVINKLDYESAPDAKSGARHFGPGQLRPRDVAHFCSWAARQLERPALNWQWVNFSMPARVFQEAPVLYIAGSEPLDFTPAQIDTLRSYVQRGGTIIGNADCQSRAFSRSFLKLGTKLFPRYEFRELPDGHVLFANAVFKATRRRRPVKVIGLSNGVRELMLLIPEADLSRAWQLDSTTARSECFELGMNLLRYASDPNEWPNRGGSTLVTPDHGIVPRRTIRIARLMVGDNPDPEPGGWERLAALMHNHFATELDMTLVNPSAGSLTRAAAPFQVAYVTGTTKLSLSAEARSEIVAFVNGGGTLIVDAAGGSETFANSAANELARMFPPPAGPGATTRVLLPQDNVYILHIASIDQFGYRGFARHKIEGQLNVPRIQGIQIGNRTAVFFSLEDLANGLVGESTDGVIGYTPETATAIMRNLLLYAAGER